MTKKKPPPEKPRPKTDDADQAFAEASALLGFGGDPSKLCGADRVRIGMVAGLTAAVDAATESLLAGNSSAGDIGRLTSSVDALIRLLPKAATEAPSHREDPRAALLKLILQQRERDGIGDEGINEQAAELAALRTENERLRRAAGLAVTPTEADVVPPGEIGEFFRGPPVPGPDDPKPHVVIEHEATAAPSYDYDRERGWRDHVLPDGSITPTPMSRGKYWGPV